jgi:nucleotide-binding universal stress UspA family protein
VSPPSTARRRPAPFGGAAGGGEPPDPDLLRVRAVLLASEDRRIPKRAIDLAARMAKRSGAPVHVLTVARIWGTSLGFPNPGLFPSRGEWQEQHDNVERAIARLERKGVTASGRVVGTRSGAKRIVAEARRLDCDAIVMGADPPRSRALATFMWSQEPYRVRRRADRPVFLVVDSET